MNLFDVLNKLMGRKTTGEVRESNERSRRLKRDAELRASAARATPRPAKPFKPTQNDPEYYAQNGQAKNEAEAQRLVNSYRETQVPGSKPLFDNFAPKTQVAPLEVKPVIPKPSIIAPFQRVAPTEDRYKITSSRF